MTNIEMNNSKNSFGGLGFKITSPQDMLNNTIILTKQSSIATSDYFNRINSMGSINSDKDASFGISETGTGNVTIMSDIAEGTCFGSFKTNPYLRGCEMEIGYSNENNKISGSIYSNDVVNGAKVEYTHSFSKNEAFGASVSTQRVNVGYKKKNIGVHAYSSLSSREYFGIGTIINF